MPNKKGIREVMQSLIFGEILWYKHSTKKILWVQFYSVFNILICGDNLKNILAITNRIKISSLG